MKRDDANRYLLTLFLTSSGQPHYCKNQPASLRSDALPTSTESSAHINGRSNCWRGGSRSMESSWAGTGSAGQIQSYCGERQIDRAARRVAMIATCPESKCFSPAFDCAALLAVQR